MPATKESKIRLKLLYDLLYQYTDENNPLSSEQIIALMREKYNIMLASRVLLEDVKLLNEYGYDIQYFRKKSTFYYVVERYFEIPELKILMDAVQAASFIPAEQTAQFTAKIAEIAGNYRAEVLKRDIVCFNTNKHSNKYVFYSVDTLVLAIESKRKASFLYFDFDVDKKKIYRKNGERYTVNPLALIFTNDKYYLVCYHDKYPNLCNYRIDRMEKVEVEPTEFTPAPEFENFNIQAYKQQAFSMFAGEVEDVTLLVDNCCIDTVLDRFGENTQLTRHDDTHFTVTAQVQVSPTFFAWCLTSCNKIKIAKPENVVTSYKEYINSAIPI